MAPEEEEEGGGGGGSGRSKGTQSSATDINTNTAAPAGLPDSRQGSPVGIPPTPDRLGARGGEMSAAPAPAPRVFLSGCRSGKEAGGLSKPGVAGPQGKSFRLAEAPRPVVPRAMPAPLSLSSSRGTGRLGLPESAGRGGLRCRGAARRAGSGPRPLLAPPGRRPALATNFNQVSCAGALAWLRAPACAPRPGPRSPGFSGRSRADAGRRCWRRGFKENAPSPLFAGPRWGCSRFPHSRSTGGPFLAQAATPPLPRRQEPRARAQVSVATCVCTRPEPARGVHVRPRLSVCISGGMQRRWSPRLQEGGGTSGASSRSHTPRTAN